MVRLAEKCKTPIIGMHPAKGNYQLEDAEKTAH